MGDVFIPMVCLTQNNAHNKAVLSSGTAVGPRLRIDDATLDHIHRQHPHPSELLAGVPRKSMVSLGQAVDAITRAKAASGCYDKDGNLIPGSPCDKKKAV